MPEYPEIMTPAQVGEWLNISSKQVRRLAAAGRLPGVQVGSLWRFSRRRPVEWFEDQD